MIRLKPHHFSYLPIPTTIKEIYGGRLEDGCSIAGACTMVCASGCLNPASLTHLHHIFGLLHNYKTKAIDRLSINSKELVEWINERSACCFAQSNRVGLSFSYRASKLAGR